MRIFKKIYDFWRYDFPRGIKNLVIWFPTVWNDRQWDHYFIYKMLRQKLHFTEQLIRYNGHHLYHLRDADRIKLCVDLLDRLMNDAYHETAFKIHEEKWGEPKMNWIDDNRSDGCVELKITHPNVITEKDKENERKHFKRSCNHENMLREQDLDMLFAKLRKHVQSWWD
jgi:hypothetical protein